MPCLVDSVDVRLPFLGQVGHISLTGSSETSLRKLCFCRTYVWLGQAFLDNLPIIIKSTDLGLYTHLQYPFTEIPVSVNDQGRCVYTRGQESLRASSDSATPRCGRFHSLQRKCSSGDDPSGQRALQDWWCIFPSARNSRSSWIASALFYGFLHAISVK